MFKVGLSRELPIERPVLTAPLAGKKILVLEDEPILALELEEALLAAGAARVGLCFCISPRTMDAAKKATFVVLDLYIQGKSSAPVVAELERLGIPFIIVTGHPAGAGDIWARHHPRFAKPVDMPELINSISRS